MRFIARLRVSRLWPSRWPIRWKLAAVSAGLTFIILVVFGFVVGQLTTQQLRDNYAADTKAAAEDLVGDIRRVESFTPGYALRESIAPLVDNAAGPADLTSILSSVPDTIASKDAKVLGTLRPDRTIRQVGHYQVATVPYEDTPDSGNVIGYVRVARPIDRLDTSINRIWISILAGTLGATLLAALAGVMLSRRAMRPVSRLTSAAGEIARTRDTTITLESPIADDEVAELTRTFNDMLHELSISRVEKERSLTRQREFVADASHELRTPLTSVLANLELLEHSLRSQSNQAELESVESALRSSRRMKRLVADLQILARADSGQAQPKGSCDLSRIAADAVAELAPLSRDHRIALDANERATVKGNADDLHRVILNLIDNAVRHTPEGSTISVTVDPSLETGLVRLMVADDGPGIPEDVRSHIFDRFVRNAGPSDRASTKGTGLGLAIVLTIAQAHGGTASVGDSADGGAMFTVELPLEQNPMGGSLGNR